MDDLYFTLDDLYAINDCIEVTIELLQTKLPTEEIIPKGFNDIHVFNKNEDLPEDIQEELDVEKDLEQLIELHNRVNVMIDEFIKEEELENQELNNIEEVNDMKIPSWVANLIYNKGVQNEIDEVDRILEEVEEKMEEVNEVVEEVEEVVEYVENVVDEIENEEGPLTNFIDEMINVTMDQVIGQLMILSKILQDEKRCDLCGGYKLYDLKPEYFAVLNAVGYGVENVCECNVEVACEDENNNEENVQFAAEFNFAKHVENVAENIVKKRRKGTRKQAPKKCKGNCTNCKCKKNDEPEVKVLEEVEAEFEELGEFVNLNDVLLMEDVQEADSVKAVDLYYNSLFEDAAEFVLNRPVEVLWACEEGVEPPTKNEEDMGFDVKAHFEEDYMMFKPHETKLVPTGLYAAVPTLWGLLAREKGSTGAIGMKCGAGVVDSGYRGEIFIAITNENDCHLVITKDPDVKKTQRVEWVDWEKNESFEAILYPYKKGIAQLLVKFNPKVETRVVTVDELKAMPSLRGEGKLGSTDNL